jgi:hypothetical protein
VRIEGADVESADSADKSEEPETTSEIWNWPQQLF